MGKVTHHRWEECSYESLPQWVKRRGGRFLRGRSFFYVCQATRDLKPNGGYEYQTIYHRKLRYKSNEVCKHFLREPSDWGRTCFYDGRDSCSYDRDSHKDKTHNMEFFILTEQIYGDRVTEDIMRRQDWLNEIARCDTRINPAYIGNYSMEVYLTCGGDWCPAYE